MHSTSTGDNDNDDDMYKMTGHRLVGSTRPWYQTHRPDHHALTSLAMAMLNQHQTEQWD